MEKVTITIENADKSKRATFTLQDNPDGSGYISISLLFEPEAPSVSEEDYLNVTALITDALQNA